MRREFAKSVLEQLKSEKILQVDDSILAVAGGVAEKELFHSFGFKDVTISNLDDRMIGDEFVPYKWSRQDAQSLSFGDHKFDYSFVSDGLHHCSSPHRALLEMYRVAKKGVIVIESRDSYLLKIAQKMNLTQSYEITAVVRHDLKYGGVNNSEIPNFIYRWTENEFQKTINSFNPTGRHNFRFFYDLNLPFWSTSLKTKKAYLYILKLTSPIVRLFTRVFKKQCNSFSMVAIKPDGSDDLWPWLERQEDRIVFNRNYAAKFFKK